MLLLTLSPLLFFVFVVVVVVAVVVVVVVVVVVAVVADVPVVFLAIAARGGFVAVAIAMFVATLVGRSVRFRQHLLHN